MSIVTAAGGSRAGQFVALCATALREIRWKQVRGAMAFGIAVTIVTALMFVGPLVRFAETMSVPMFLLGAAINDQIKALCLFAAIVVADRAVDEGAVRHRAYLVAALAGCTIGVLLTQLVDWPWRQLVLKPEYPRGMAWLHGSAGQFYRPIFALTHWYLIGGAAVFLYADGRAARQTEARLRAAELDRIRRSKLALESRLQAMQARVEPQFLFNTLAQVERLYELDPALAAHMLDDLIAYLRAAMPLMRDTSSTLAQEIALARAYLDIVRLRLGQRLAVTIDAPQRAEEIRMPPMMLLPLIDHAVVRGLEPSSATGTISIRTEVANGRLRLTIADSGAGFVPEADGGGVATIRERLAALYGDDARLDLRQADARATEAVLDLPLEVRGSVEEPAHAASLTPTASARA